MATTTCGSFQLLQGSLLPLLCSPRPAKSSTRCLGLVTATSAISSDLHCFSSSRCSSKRSSESSDRRTRMASASFSSTNDRVEPDENPEGIISGEWPENFSLLSYDDLRAYLEPQIFKEQMRPSTLLGEVMSTPTRAASADQTLEEIDHHFEFVSGLPVIDSELRCIGVVSKKDKDKASHGLKSKVVEVMSSPAITLSPDKTVMDAAALMLKMKIHRIPVINEERQVVGMVTRTDIFQALETLKVTEKNKPKFRFCVCAGNKNRHSHSLLVRLYD